MSFPLLKDFIAFILARPKISENHPQSSDTSSGGMTRQVSGLLWRSGVLFNRSTAQRVIPPLAASTYRR
ncbi:hypothetical protein NG799_20135 [Laspinema sp. D1]|uniref:Uncharacterized protein n=1 Tax=Laspinema palackyanum D2a TaxID=2953684 RepID=A0ABT2MV60_9CYAN|nr:hypothetical protein [Laspinema sp. D2a]